MPFSSFICRRIYTYGALAIRPSPSLLSGFRFLLLFPFHRLLQIIYWSVPPSVHLEAAIHNLLLNEPDHRYGKVGSINFAGRHSIHNMGSTTHLRTACFTAIRKAAHWKPLENAWSTTVRISDITLLSGLTSVASPASPKIHTVQSSMRVGILPYVCVLSPSDWMMNATEWSNLWSGAFFQYASISEPVERIYALRSQHETDHFL